MNPRVQQSLESCPPRGAHRVAYGTLVAAFCLALAACGGGGGTAGNPASHTVTATAGNGGNISPANASVDDGATADFTVTADTGYAVTGVNGCGGDLSGNTYTTAAITHDCTVSASFALQTLTVTAAAGAGGAITPATSTVEYGTTKTLTVTADNGYDIADVTGCGGTLAGNTYTTGDVTADCTVTANFTPKSYTVTATAGSGGTISSIGDTTVNYGDTASFTVTANDGYIVNAITGCGGSMAVDTSLTGDGNYLTAATYTTADATADCTVAASFVENPVAFSNGQAASVVIGQPDFTSSAAATTQSGLSQLFGNADVIDGTLYIGDYGNSRVLGFSAIPNSNGANADFVIGASDFTSVGTVGGDGIADDNGLLFVASYGDSNIAVYDFASSEAVSFYLTAADVGGFGPGAVAAAGGKLVVSDLTNHRVLIWDATPTADTAPDLVLGQVDFTGTSPNAGATATANTLYEPAGVWTDGQRLVVNDAYNNRVLIWNTFPTENDQAADLVLGQTDFNSTSANQGLAAPTDGTLSQPYTGVYAFGNQLFVADELNHRVLIWNHWPTANGQVADRVLGQPDFTTATSATSATGMYAPTGVYLYGTQLIVTEVGNHRYTIFDGSYD